MRNDFCVFILSHGRANKIKTLQSLKKGNYTGDYFIIIDNEDDTADEYRKIYGDKVIMFDKLAMSKTFDTADNFDDRRTIVYARNACFDIAERLGYRYFLELDDDYTVFHFRKAAEKFIAIDVKQLDRLFDEMIKFLDASGALTVAFAQGGDFLGGKDKDFTKGIKRKAMNTFFCDVKKRFDFLGRVNEDVNTYVSLGSKGSLFLTITNASICQMQTQANSGGMTEMYLDSGTYVKSFYTVMYNPSCVKISKMLSNHPRLHHRINWNNCVPKIISDKYKK